MVLADRTLRINCLTAIVEPHYQPPNRTVGEGGYMQCGGWELKGPGQHARELMTVTRGPATAVKGAVKGKKQ